MPTKKMNRPNLRMFFMGIGFEFREDKLLTS
jgi:hypothetical protein